MSDATQNAHTSAPRLRLPEVLFASFCLVLALLALASFWPPRSAAVIAWLLLWVGLCLASAISVLSRARYSRIVVWALNIVAGLSALTALSNGLLHGIGIVIDIVLLIPMVCFAIWHDTSRRRPGVTDSVPGI